MAQNYHQIFSTTEEIDKPSAVVKPVDSSAVAGSQSIDCKTNCKLDIPSEMGGTSKKNPFPQSELAIDTPKKILHDVVVPAAPVEVSVGSFIIIFKNKTL